MGGRAKEVMKFGWKNSVDTTLSLPGDEMGGMLARDRYEGG